MTEKKRSLSFESRKTLSISVYSTHLWYCRRKEPIGNYSLVIDGRYIITCASANNEASGRMFRREALTSIVRSVSFGDHDDLRQEKQRGEQL